MQPVDSKNRSQSSNAGPMDQNRQSRTPAPGQTSQTKYHMSYESNVKPLGDLDGGSVNQLFGQKAPKQPPKKDPAPSRASYKLQRLWLTPMVRSMAKSAIPVAGLLGIAGYLISNENLRNDISTRVIEVHNSIKTRPEFMVELMKIKGSEQKISQDIRETLNLDFPISSFELDLPILRKKIENLDSVKTASLFLRTGGILDIVIQERHPVVLWRSTKGLELLDADGVRAGTANTRLDYKSLPLIAGAGAETKVQEAMSILAAARPIEARVRGLLYVGERRWDLILDRDQTVLLPEGDPISAVERLIAWQSAQSILSRDITVVDLRNPNRPYLRLTPYAMDDLRGTRAVFQGEETKL